MKPYAAAAGIEYGCSQQVIEVYQHGEHEYQVGFDPMGFIDKIGNK
jgi:hypothetical protein